MEEPIDALGSKEIRDHVVQGTILALASALIGWGV